LFLRSIFLKTALHPFREHAFSNFALERDEEKWKVVSARYPDPALNY
jgi:hypothetical protein